jgi:hypothetical protein
METDNTHIVRKYLAKVGKGKKSLRGDGLIERVAKKLSLSVIEVKKVFERLKLNGELHCSDWYNCVPLGMVVLNLAEDIKPAEHQDWLKALQQVELTFEEIAQLEPAYSVLVGFELEDLKHIAEGLKCLREEQCSLFGQSRYIISARYLLGSSKLLDSLPTNALKAFGIQLDQFTSAPSYVVIAGPPDPEVVVLVENPQAMETAVEANVDGVAWVATFGYGLSMVGDDYGRQLASIIETSQRQIRSLIRSGNPPNIESLLAHDNIFFWPDLDAEGLRIYQRIKKKLPKLKLSALYLPMMNMGHKPGTTHPYIKAVGKEGQLSWDKDNQPIIGEFEASLNGAHFTDDLKTKVLNTMELFCNSRGLDQEAISNEFITQLANKALVDVVLN